MSGAFVEAPLPANLFSYVKVQFNSRVDGRPTVVEGQVVRKDATGFGIEWRDLSPDVLAALLAPVRVNPVTDSQAKFPRLVFQRSNTVSAALVD